ncbi:MAG: hypothetical protein IJV89_07815 [Lentisphaeria bacterium]|nr:hypothetical protein [Lentisphaeria bacterium]
MIKKLLWGLLAVCGLAVSAAEIRVEMETGKSPTNGAKVWKHPSGAQIVRMTAKARPAAPDLKPDWTVEADVPVAGQYQIIGKCYTANSSSDSVFWTLNDAAERQLSCGIHPEGKEVIMAVFSLKAGRQTISFRTRETGFGVDYLILRPVQGKKKNAAAPRSTPGDLEAAKFRYDSKQVLADLRLENHPCVFYTPENMAAARARLKDSPELQGLLKFALEKIKPFMNKTDAEIRALIPPVGCDIVYGLGLDIDPRGGKVTWNGWSDPFRVTGKDGIIYPNKDYPDDGKGGLYKPEKRFHPRARAYGAAFAHLSNVILPCLADAYSLTLDKKYAHVAAVIMDAAAPVYASNRRGPLDYPVSAGDHDRGGRLTGAYYMASRRLMKVLDVFDRTIPSGEYMKPSATAPGRSMYDNIAENIFWNGAIFCLGHALNDPMRLNGYADFIRSPIAVGLLLNRPDLARMVMDPVKGLPSLLSNNLGREGFYCESSHMYSFHTMSLYTDLADFAESGARRKWAGFHSFYSHPLLFRFLFRCYDRLEVGGHLPVTGDNNSGPDRFYIPPTARHQIPGYSGTHQQIEYAWRILAGADDPALKKQAAKLLRNIFGNAPVTLPVRNRSVLYRIGSKEMQMIKEAELDPEYFETGSDFFGCKGLAILRGGRGNDRHGLQLMLGPQLNHGQFEALSWTFYNDGVDWSFEPGYFNTHYRFSWATRSVAHQQVVVDARNVEVKNGGALLRAWKGDGPVQYALGSQPKAYNHTERFDRLVVQVDGADGKLDYWLDISTVKGGKTRDDSFHTVMTQAEFSEKFTPTGQYALGGDAAKGMHFSNDYRLSGFPKAPFYWGLPGDGYPLLRSPAVLKTAETLRGVFTKAGFPAIAARNRTITVDFPAEEGVEYIRCQSPEAYRTVSVPYLLRRDTKAAGSVFAKVIHFDGSSVKEVKTVAASGLSRAYLITRKDGRDLWVRGALDVPDFGVKTDGEVTLVRFGADGKVSYVCASGAASVTIPGKTFDARATASGKITSMNGKVLTADLDRPAKGDLLVTAGSGLPAAWKVGGINGKKITVDTPEFFVTSSVLTPLTGRPGWYECCPNPGILRTLERSGVTLVVGRALFSNGKYLGSITHAERKGFQMFVKLDTDKPVPAGTVVQFSEAKPGDTLSVIGNFQWQARNFN